MRKHAVPVANCHKIGKMGLIHNDAMRQIEVNPETYAVRAAGALLLCDPACGLSLAQRYFLF